VLSTIDNIHPPDREGGGKVRRRIVPELLQDLWELGSDPDLVAQWLELEGCVGSEARVLDLGSCATWMLQRRE